MPCPEFTQNLRASGLKVAATGVYTLQPCQPGAKNGASSSSQKPHHAAAATQ